MKKTIASLTVAICFPYSANAQTLDCTTVLECAKQAITIALESQRAVQIAIPRGAVMAFNRETCPTGWKLLPELTGRVIVGAGEGNRDQIDRVLSKRVLGQSGGEEIHALSVNEMPSHKHKSPYSDGINSPSRVDNTPQEFGRKHGTIDTSASGGGQPHNNMPPFLVLTYCERQ